MKTINEIKDAAPKPEEFNLNHKWVVVHTQTGRYMQSECSEHAANWAARVFNQHSAKCGLSDSFDIEEVTYL